MSKVILITGVSGEVGCELVKQLSTNKDSQIHAIDINNPPKSVRKKLTSFSKTSIISEKTIENLFSKHNFDSLYHLAALLSTSAEKDPYSAHIINTQGTYNLIKQASLESKKQNKRIKFFFPSSVAVYGMSDVNQKSKINKVKENENLDPTTMYGINKLYCEQLGKYFSKNFGQLSDDDFCKLDFRCIRYPGLISAFTLPSGGTSDYAPEMIHAAVAGKNYESFARADTKIPFMAMPDAVKATIQLMKAPKKKLTKNIYNIRGFSASAKEIELELKKKFPKFRATYKVDKKRQAILDSWPEDVDDKMARKDWNWELEYDFENTLNIYLLPNLVS